MRFTAKIFVLLASLGLSGCSAFDWMVYKIDIPQGNYIDDAKVEQLRINMSKEQVRFVLGTPMLIDAFDKERWYYLYSYQSGNGDFEKRDFPHPRSPRSIKTRAEAWGVVNGWEYAEAFCVVRMLVRCNDLADE